MGCQGGCIKEHEPGSQDDRANQDDRKGHPYYTTTRPPAPLHAVKRETYIVGMTARVILGVGWGLA